MAEDRPVWRDSQTMRRPSSRESWLAKGIEGSFNPAVLQQQTINRPASFSGVGLHSGNQIGRASCRERV